MVVGDEETTRAIPRAADSCIRIRCVKNVTAAPYGFSVTITFPLMGCSIFIPSSCSPCIAHWSSFLKASVTVDAQRERLYSSSDVVHAADPVQQLPSSGSPRPRGPAICVCKHAAPDDGTLAWSSSCSSTSCIRFVQQCYWRRCTAQSATVYHA